MLQPVPASGAEPSVGGTAAYEMGGDATTLNPYTWGSVYDFNAIGAIYDPLIQYDVDNQPTAAIAKSWSHDDDFVVWTFTLHEDMKWHDGETLDGSDVLFTFNLLIDDAIKGSSIARNSWLFNWVANDTTKAATMGTAYTDATWNGWAAGDQYNISAYYPNINVVGNDVSIGFTYGVPLHDIMAELSGTLIIPEHIWEGVDVNTFTNDNPIGSGPFMFDAWEKGQFFRLTRNPDYYLGAPWVETLIVNIIREPETAFNALLAGDIDVLSRDIPVDLEELGLADPDISKHEFLADFWLYLGMNQRRYPNDVVGFRHAVLTGIDRQEIVDVARFGRGMPAPASGALPYGPWYNDGIPTYDYDPALANSMLDDMGWIDTNSDGVRETDTGHKLEFGLMVSSEFQASIDAATLIQNYMDALDIKVTLQPLLFDVIWDATGGSGADDTYNYDWAYVGWSGFWSDRTASWAGWLYDEDQWWGSDNINIPGWSGENRTKVTELTHQIQQDGTDDAKMKAYLDEIQEILAYELPYLPIDISGGMELYRTDKFEGWIMGNTAGPSNWQSYNAIYLTSSGGDDGFLPGLTLITAFTSISLLAVFTKVSRNKK